MESETPMRPRSFIERVKARPPPIKRETRIFYSLRVEDIALLHKTKQKALLFCVVAEVSIQQHHEQQQLATA